MSYHDMEYLCLTGTALEFSCVNRNRDTDNDALSPVASYNQRCALDAIQSCIRCKSVVNLALDYIDWRKDGEWILHELQERLMYTRTWSSVTVILKPQDEMSYKFFDLIRPHQIPTLSVCMEQIMGDSSQVCNSFWKALRLELSSNPKLSRLCLHGICNMTCGTVLSLAVALCSSVSSPSPLISSRPPPTCTASSPSSTGHQPLQAIELTSCKFMPNANIQPLAVALANCNIISLSLNFTIFESDEQLAALLGSVQHLTALHVCVESWQVQSLQVLCNWLLSSTCNLHYLQLQDSRFHGVQCKDSNSVWQTLYKVHHAIAQNTSLHTLNLSRNDLTNADVHRSIVPIILNSKSLRTVHLQDNWITTQGAMLLAKSLLHVSSSMPASLVQNVYLDYNDPIDKTAWEMFYRAAVYNPSLHQLWLHGASSTMPKQPIFQQLQYRLDLNKHGRKALMKPIPINLWPLLLHRAVQLKKGAQSCSSSIVYYFLRQGPVLLWKT